MSSHQLDVASDIDFYLCVLYYWTIMYIITYSMYA